MRLKAGNNNPDDIMMTENAPGAPTSIQTYIVRCIHIKFIRRTKMSIVFNSSRRGEQASSGWNGMGLLLSSLWLVYFT